MNPRRRRHLRQRRRHRLVFLYMQVIYQLLEYRRRNGGYMGPAENPFLRQLDRLWLRMTIEDHDEVNLRIEKVAT